jgi:hypothetical protein
MKRNLIGASLMCLVLAVACFSGCANLPAPKNANGSVNPSVVVAEGEITYRNAATAATTYVATCHAAPTTIGCSDPVIAQIKVANDKAWTDVQAAENAVRTLPAGATGIDKAIADMQAALVLLQGLIPRH